MHTVLPRQHWLAPLISHCAHCVATSTLAGSLHFTLCTLWTGIEHTLGLLSNDCMMCCGTVSTVVTHLPVVLSALSSHTYPWYCQHCRQTLTCGTDSTVVRHLWYCQHCRHTLTRGTVSTVVRHLPVVLSALSLDTYLWYCQHCR